MEFSAPVLGLIKGYQISDVDDASAVRYYGFLGIASRWYILKENTTAKTYRYIAGTGDYSTAWTARETHTYLYFDQVFTS